MVQAASGQTGKARINARIRRLSLGNPGNVRAVEEGVSELRIDYGPGYRIYFVQRGQSLALLLAGGDTLLSGTSLRGLYVFIHSLTFSDVSFCHSRHL